MRTLERRVTLQPYSIERAFILVHTDNSAYRSTAHDIEPPTSTWGLIGVARDIDVN